MSDEEKDKFTSESKKSKWYSIITAVIVLVRTIVDIFFK